ncbi:hypothetical protein T440DRAFT_486779 [Plenodomus tracheiphilus IPT5]|uniref:GST N-terminal domain-containing protein n=1 Tax=Plenodomus tracheiphilus IPT5 TaxID=1408161 RepID=A0A6A7BFJ6_9PLEO|nr:hypothetical protein T440DRAFT_486779 [Plenodomus tracheiphilus IPT5]
MASTFRGIIPSDRFPAEKGRYVLYFNAVCPWAHRAILIYALKGLEDIIQLVEVDARDPVHGWYFSGQRGPHQDPVQGAKWLKELYLLADPDYSGRVTIPVLWDKQQSTIVSTESADIARMLIDAFDHLLPEDKRESSKGKAALRPAHLLAEIDELNDWVYDTVNNGVYKVGLTKSPAAYTEHLTRLFQSLDRLEDHLSKPEHQPYLFGPYLTEADVRLYTTAIRFDVAYYPFFQCNLKMIRLDYPHLHDWLRRLYWDDGASTNGGVFRKTTNFDVPLFCLHTVVTVLSNKMLPTFRLLQRVDPSTHVFHTRSHGRNFDSSTVTTSLTSRMPKEDKNPTSGDESKSEKPAVNDEEVRQESSKAADASLQAQKRANELKKAAAGAGDADERQKLMEQAIDAQIEAESFGKTAKYMRSGAFQGLAMGTGLGVAPGATLGAITGTLVGSVSSTLLGGIGGGIGAAAGAINGPFWDLSKLAGKGIRKVTGDLPSWAASDEQKKSLEKMLEQVNDQDMPDTEELKGLVKDGGGAAMDEGWLKKMKSYLPSMPSLPGFGGSKEHGNGKEQDPGPKDETEEASTSNADSSSKPDDQPRKKPPKLQVKPHPEKESPDNSSSEKRKPRKLETRSKHNDQVALKTKDTKPQPPKLEKRSP